MFHPFHTDCYASALSGSLTDAIVRWNGQEKAPTL